MADLTLDEALRKITGLEKQLEQSTASINELTPRAAELDTSRASEAKLKVDLDILATSHHSAQEQLKEFETTKESLIKLQESHTQLETRHTDSIKGRLKSFGLADDKYESRSLVELEAMESALSGYTPPSSSGSGNPPLDPSKAGLEGSGKEGGSDSSTYAVELAEIERARNRGK